MLDGQKVIAQILKETRFLKRHPAGKKHIIYVDNVGSHSLTDELRKVLKVQH